MQTLTNYLKERIQQLEHRKMSIPIYLEHPGKFLGNKDFSMSDIPKIEQDIKECEVALKSVAAHKKGKILIFLDH